MKFPYLYKFKTKNKQNQTVNNALPWHFLKLKKKETKMLFISSANALAILFLYFL